MGERENNPVTKEALMRYKQRMDHTVSDYQLLLLSPNGEAWHEVLKLIMEHNDPQKVLALLQGCPKT